MKTNVNHPLLLCFYLEAYKNPWTIYNKLKFAEQI